MYLFKKNIVVIFFNPKHSHDFVYVVKHPVFFLHVAIMTVKSFIFPCSNLCPTSIYILFIYIEMHLCVKFCTICVLFSTHLFYCSVAFVTGNATDPYKT